MHSPRLAGWVRYNLIRQKADVGVSRLPVAALFLQKTRPKSHPAARTGFHFNYNISECKFCDCDRIWARGKPSQSEEVKPIVPPLFITARFLPCRRCSTPDTRLIKPEQTHFRCSFECPFFWRVWWKSQWVWYTPAVSMFIEGKCLKNVTGTRKISPVIGFFLNPFDRYNKAYL